MLHITAQSSWDLIKSLQQSCVFVFTASNLAFYYTGELVRHAAGSQPLWLGVNYARDTMKLDAFFLIGPVYERTLSYSPVSLC